LQDNTKENLIKTIEKFFEKNEMNYDEALKIFDKGLIQALIKKYPSKLQLSKALKINRATLSKKMEKL